MTGDDAVSYCAYAICMERSPPFWSCCQEASSPNCWWITAFIDIRTEEEKNSWQTTAYNMSERAQGGVKVTSGSRRLQRVAGTCTDNVSHWEFKLCLIQADFQVGSEVIGVGQQLHTMKISTERQFQCSSRLPSTQSVWVTEWLTLLHSVTGLSFLIENIEAIRWNTISITPYSHLHLSFLWSILFFCF